MYNPKTINQKIIGTLRILSIKSMDEITRVLNVYQLTQEDFMLQLTEQEKTDFATLEMDGDFGLNTTYNQPGDKVAHLSDVELLAQLDGEGDFGRNDPYNKPDLIAESGNKTIFIQAK